MRIERIRIQSDGAFRFFLTLAFFGDYRRLLRVRLHALYSTRPLGLFGRLVVRHVKRERQSAGALVDKGRGDGRRIQPATCQRVAVVAADLLDFGGVATRAMGSEAALQIIVR